MMAAGDFGAWISAKPFTGEKVLPAKFLGGMGIFFRQGMGEIYASITVGQVLLMKLPDLFYLQGQGDFYRSGKDCGPVFGTFSVPDIDEVPLDIQVFYAQSNTLHQPQSCSI